MDGVTAGLGNNLIALANAAAVSIGNFDSETATLTATVTDQGLGSSVAEFCHHGGRDLGDHRCVYQGWFQRNREPARSTDERPPSHRVTPSSERSTR